MNKHEQIIEELKRQQHFHQNPLCMDLLLDDTDCLIRSYFLNYRGKNSSHGLRLSNDGLIVMKIFFKHWNIELSKDSPITSKDIIYLDRVCTMPWYLNKQHLTLFEKKLALKIKLAGTTNLFSEEMF